MGITVNHEFWHGLISMIFPKIKKPEIKWQFSWDIIDAYMSFKVEEGNRNFTEYVHKSFIYFV